MRLSSLNIISRTRVARPVSLHVCRNMGLNTQAQNINLNKLREKMSEINVKALIVPSDDPHLSEYVAPCFERRAFISSFTGSAGTALITDNDALLWTDSRYFLQAKNELSSSWTLMSGSNQDIPMVDYIQKTFKEGDSIAVDALTLSVVDAEETEKKLAEYNISVKYPSYNLIDSVWDKTRPPLPTAPLRIQDIKYAGVGTLDKLLDASQHVKGDSVMVLCALDEIAWLLNLRGGDIPFNPVFLAYLICHNNQSKDNHLATLYVDKSKLSKQIVDYLIKSRVEIREYENIKVDIEALISENQSICFDPTKMNYELVKQVPRSLRVELDSSPVTVSKAVKNDAEVEGMRSAHLKDGAAMVEFMSWFFSDRLKEVDEVDLDRVLTGFRKLQPGFVDLAFPTIAGVNGNGAIIHYKAEEETCAQVLPNAMVLIDSGAQYLEGTTDVTRTLHTGQPTAFQTECFTRVLKGHIALDSSIFPTDTPGFVLDILARKSLWEGGLDYGHGTGHGVGAALNVHEGPIGISPRYSNMNGLKAGMIVSNEPGYYHEGCFGIRIENLLLITKAPNVKQGAEILNKKQFLKFERLTLVPIQKTLLDLSMLIPQEIEWVNQYHVQVRESISPLLEHNTRAREWLIEATTPI